MKITESNCLPTAIHVEDVRLGMRVKYQLSDDYPWATVVRAKASDQPAGKIEIDIREDGKMEDDEHVADPGFTWYYFAEGWKPERDGNGGVTVPEMEVSDSFLLDAFKDFAPYLSTGILDLRGNMSLDEVRWLHNDDLVNVLLPRGWVLLATALGGEGWPMLLVGRTFVGSSCTLEDAKRVVAEQQRSRSDLS